MPGSTGRDIPPECRRPGPAPTDRVGSPSPGGTAADAHGPTAGIVPCRLPGRRPVPCGPLVRSAVTVIGQSWLFFGYYRRHGFQGWSMYIWLRFGLVLTGAALSSCWQGPETCAAGEPDRTMMVKRAIRSIRARSNPTNRASGFDNTSIRPGCCYVIKRLPTFSNISTYVVEISWYDKKYSSNRFRIEYLDECGVLIEKTGY